MLKFLKAFAVSALLAVGACGTTSSPTPTPVLSPLVISDAALIANALEAELPALAVVLGADSPRYAAVATQVGAIVAAAFHIANAVDQNSAAPLVTQIVNDFSALSQDLSGVSLPPGLRTAMSAIQILLPVIELAVELASSPRPPPAQTDAARATLGAVQ